MEWTVPWCERGERSVERRGWLIFFSIKLIIYNFEKVGSFQLYLYLKGLSKECVDVLFEFLKTKVLECGMV